MYNMINSQNMTFSNTINANPIAMGKKKIDYIEAPQSLPKFSIGSVLKERDDFRKQITYNQQYQENKIQRKIEKKPALTIAAMAAFILLVLNIKKK